MKAQLHNNTPLDYYPFGMLMPGRSYSSTAYKYGFNGQEKDDEVKGVGNSLDFGDRVYDSRFGRWMSLDPLQSKYPSLTPYQFSSNSPIFLIDKEGREIRNAETNAENITKVQAAIDIVRDKDPELYFYLHTLKVHDGVLVSPGQPNYEIADPVIVNVKITDIDGIPESQESRKYDQDFGRNETEYNESSHNNGITYTGNVDFEPGGKSQGILSIDERELRFENGKLFWYVGAPTNDKTIKVEVTESVAARFETNLVTIKDNTFTVYLDDYINKSGVFSNDQNKRRGSSLAHELGHVKGALKHFLNYMYYRLRPQPQNAGKNNGHQEGDKTGECADEEQEKIDNSK